MKFPREKIELDLTASNFGDKCARIIIMITVIKASETFDGIAKDLSLPVQEVMVYSTNLYMLEQLVEPRKRFNKVSVKAPDKSYDGTIMSMMNK